LTSDHVANAEHVSHFHIHPKSAHTLLAKACLSVLLHPDYTIEKLNTKNLPLITYAAEHWMEPARFQDVSSYIRDGIDLLFDKDKPHFPTWVGVYNIDRHGHLPRGNTSKKRHPFPLYYAALCGIGGLVERLLTAHPQHPDAAAGYYGAPLNAALAKGYLDIAQFLLDHGAVGNNMGDHDQTGLYIASSRGYTNVVRSLIDRGANLNARCTDYYKEFREVWWTPLHAAIYNDHPDIALLLLESGTNPETQSSKDPTALYMASFCGQADVVRWLIDHGADLNAKCRDWKENGNRVEWTPLYAGIKKERRDIVLLLLEGGAVTEARSHGETALYLASSRGCADIMRQLITHGTNPNAECEGWTPLHKVSYHGRPKIARILLEHGANPNALNPLGRAALHMTEEISVVDLLLEYGVKVDVRDKEGCTPLHKAAFNLKLPFVAVLLDRGADPHVRTNDGKTPFQLANTPFPWASRWAS
jgi:ankyrin repeat protein